MNNSNVVINQEEFFNINAAEEKEVVQDELFYSYANKEQFEGLRWLKDCPLILDYGCGTGTSIDLFLKLNKDDYNIIGIDIAQIAIDKVSKKYPEHTFYKISNNKMPKVKDVSMDGCYMFHVLHHAEGHAQIFNEIGKKLKPGAKFLINDLTSHNIFIRFGRFCFKYLSPLVKGKFKDDLVVDGKIPDKYPLDVELIKEQLKDAGFEIEAIEFGHLFFFLFGWLDRFIPLSRISFIRTFYTNLQKLEERLLVKSFYKNRAEVIVFKCIKK